MFGWIGGLHRHGSWKYGTRPLLARVIRYTRALLFEIILVAITTVFPCIPLKRVIVFSSFTMKLATSLTYTAFICSINSLLLHTQPIPYDPFESEH